jgi:hypothetical protein
MTTIVVPKAPHPLETNYSRGTPVFVPAEWIAEIRSIRAIEHSDLLEGYYEQD